MELFKAINEDAKEDAGEKHVKDERKYFEENVSCLNDLVEFCNKEKAEADDDGRKTDYESIARKSRVLIKELEKHLDRYK